MSISDERIDQAIDDAASRMTAGEPSAPFTGRVIARLERLDAHPLGSRSLTWLPAAAALAAAVVALVFWNTPTSREEARPQAPVSAVRADRPREVRPDTLAATTPPTSATARPAAAYHAGMPTDTATATPGPAPSPLDALAPPRIDVAPVAVAPLAMPGIPPPAPIETDTLESVAPVAVTPLGSDEPQRRF